MTEPTPPALREDNAAPPPSYIRTAGALCLLIACILAVLLAIRPLASPDLGYHLTYGEQFLDTGRIVDHNPYIYTLPEHETAPSGPLPARPTPGPGCWYDAQGKYRFVNANWLSQAIMAAVHRLGGVNALVALQASLVAGIVLLTAGTARRMGVPAILSAAGIALVAMTAYARFNLRPELFGYLLLAGQLFVLAGPQITWPAVAALAVLQLLLVNVHSYFLLGLALTGAVTAEALLRLAWLRARHAQGGQELRNARRRAALLGVALAVQLALSFANPWTWRGAVLPVQTLIFMRVNDIAGSSPAGMGHPWSRIGEFFRPFAPGAFAGAKATQAYCVLLGLAAAGAIAAALRRQWAWLAIIAGMTLVSLSMRRNIAPAAILIIPPALACIWSAGKGLTARLPNAARASVSLAVVGAVLACSAYWIVSVVTNEFYYRDRLPWRFGAGVSQLTVPLDAADWLGRNRPAGRVWTDYNSSSNLHYFTQPHPDVPILTNTWAYPPDVMTMVLDAGRDAASFIAAAKHYAVEVVVLRVDSASGRLARHLVDSPDWSLVALDAWHAVFVRAGGPNAALAGRDAISEQSLDVPKLISRFAARDARSAYSLNLGGVTLLQLGMHDAAAEVLQAAADDDPQYYEAWNSLGHALAGRGNQRLAAWDLLRAREDLLRARQSFLRCLAIQPDYRYAIANLALVERQLAQLQ